MIIPAGFTARLDEMRMPRAKDLEDPLYDLDMKRAFLDRMEEFVAGCPMLVTFVPTSNGKELLRIETQHPQDKTKKAVSYVWPRPNQ